MEKKEVEFTTKSGKKVKFKAKPKKLEKKGARKAKSLAKPKNYRKVKKAGRPKEKYPIFKETNYNNKSRKGEYIYIKLDSKDIPTIIRKKDEYSKEDYLKYVKDKKRAEKLGMIKKPTMESYLKKQKKFVTIEKALKKGIGFAILKNMHSATPIDFTKAYKTMLQRLVRDKDLMEILVREENVEKFKHRLGYEVYIKDEKDETLATLSHLAKKTLQQVVREIRENVPIGMEVADFSPLIKDKVKPLGWEYSHRKNGRVGKVEIKMVFRKG